MEGLVGGWGTVGAGGIWSVDSEGSIRAAQEELSAVRFDGFDLGGAVADELDGIIGTVYHVLLLLVRFGTF